MAQATQPVLMADNRAAAPIRVRRIGAFLGAEVTGVDLTRPLDPATVDAIRLAHAQHGVLVFPDQRISSEDLKRFGRCFGELTVHPFSTSAKDAPELIVYDNKEGNPPPPTDIWHYGRDVPRRAADGHHAVLEGHPGNRRRHLLLLDDRGL